jgi:hypothetical protein
MASVSAGFIIEDVLKCSPIPRIRFALFVLPGGSARSLGFSKNELMQLLDRIPDEIIRKAMRAVEQGSDAVWWEAARLVKEKVDELYAKYPMLKTYVENCDVQKYPAPPAHGPRVVSPSKVDVALTDALARRLGPSV